MPYGQPPQQAGFAPPVGPPGGTASGLPQTTIDALKRLSSTRVFDFTGTVPEIEQAIGAIRAMGSRNYSRRNIYGVMSVVSLVAFGYLGLVMQTPLMWLVSIGGLVGFLIARSRHPLFENRRIEMTSGLVRKLDIGPNMPVRVHLDLRPLEGNGKVAAGGPAGPIGFTTTNYEDPWLDLEGTLASGLGFYFRRVDCLTHSVKVEYRGRTTTTYTRRTGTFTDGVVLRFSSQQYPHVASLGQSIASSIKLPEGMEVRHFGAQEGNVALTIACPFKWDSGPHKHGVFEGVTGASIVFEISALLLDKSVKPVREAESLPRDAGNPAVLAGTASPYGLPAGLAAAAVAAMIIAGGGASNYVYASSEADRYEAQAARAKDPSSKSSARSMATFYGDRATTAIIQASGGGVAAVGLLIGATIVFLKRRK
jgi:hypothetical protein